MRRFIALLFVLVWLAPLGASAQPSTDPHIIACGGAERLAYFSHTPASQYQTYRVAYTVRGVGATGLHETPIYHYHRHEVNSPQGFTSYSFEVTVERYPGRPTELYLDGYGAGCPSSHIVFSDVSITPVFGKQVRADH